MPKTLRFRIAVTLLDGERDTDMERAARSLLLMVAAELVRASARMENDWTRRKPEEEE